MELEFRYWVFKDKDLTDEERGLLTTMGQRVNARRIEAGKPPLQGLVVERDWPEFNPVWNAIVARVQWEAANAQGDH